jgi:Zn-dependent peptidase ImmA (M78 family)
VQIIDGLTEKPVLVPVKKGTVVVDLSLYMTRTRNRLRCTLAHEGAHWLLHRKAFSENNPFQSVGVPENRQLAAKKGRIDYSRSLKDKTDVDTIERQADFLAAAILMPRPALRVAYREYFEKCNEKPRQLSKMAGIQEVLRAYDLSSSVASTFNVSYRAAQIRLEKLKAIVDRKQPATPRKTDRVTIICAR